MTGRGPFTGRRSRLSRRRLPPGVLTLLSLAPTLDALVAITGNRALAILAVNTARVALLQPASRSALATSPVADAAGRPQRRRLNRPPPPDRRPGPSHNPILTGGER